MTIQLYNTLSRKKEAFKPIEKGRVSLYTCGPTVYWYAHIGNLRTYIFEDILRRTLEYNNYKVKQVMNITDIGHLTSDADEGEDKIIKAALHEQKTPKEIAEFYTKTFQADLKKLNILEPNIWCKVTEHIKEQIELIQKLEKNGYTYQAGGNIYFNTVKFKNYDKLARLNLKATGKARIEKDPNKKNPHDFVLWFTKSKFQEQEMKWPSPWGEGYPGWHIECSAMSMKYLGENFDIHCGGIDHIPVHHTNELAQSEAATGKKFVNYWLHGDFLLLDQGKMAKSEGKIITLNNLIEKSFNPLAFRYLCLTAHYRSKLNFNWQSLEAAQNALNKLYEIFDSYETTKISCLEYEKQFLQAINDDLNTPQALAVTWQMVKDKKLPISCKKQSLIKFDKILGLNLRKTEKAMEKAQKIELPADIKKLGQLREQARQNKDWQKADEIRKQIQEKGYEVEDTAEGLKIKKSKPNEKAAA